MAQSGRPVPDDILPAVRQLDPAVSDTPLHTEIAATRSAALMHQEQLTRQGSRVLTKVFKTNQQEFFDATEEGLEIISAAKSDDHREIVAKFFIASTRDLHSGMRENYLLAEAQVNRVTAADFALAPPAPRASQPPPRRQVVEQRSLSLSERLSGRAWFSREE